MRSALLEAWQHGGDGLPLVTRLVLTGETDSAGALIDSAADLRDVARAVAASISPNLFIEKVKLLVTKPAAAGEVIVGDDLAALIDRAAPAIGRAAGRERGCQAVDNSVVAVTIK